MLKLIACVDENWGLGCKGQLLFHLPEDMAFFKAKTMGETVLLGRKTLESFPQGRPLPGREHLLLCRGEVPEMEHVVVCHSAAEALEQCEGCDEVWVIGGAEVYRQLLPYCGEAYVTKVAARRAADTFLTNLDEAEEWILSDCSPWRRSGGLSYCFCRYLHK